MGRRLFHSFAAVSLVAVPLFLGSFLTRQSARAAVQASSPTEVAVLQGVLENAETIPLPVYADGTQALESECKWIVSPCLGYGTEPFYCYAADAIYSTTTLPTKDFMALHKGRIVNCGPGGLNTASQSNANYLIIATRGSSQATPAIRASWGSVKARYR